MQERTIVSTIAATFPAAALYAGTRALRGSISLSWPALRLDLHATAAAGRAWAAHHPIARSHPLDSRKRKSGNFGKATLVGAGQGPGGK